MKTRLHIFYTAFLFFVSLFTANGQFTDDFSDGDFTNNPTWAGDDSVFTIVSVSGNNRLRSAKEIASTSFYLSTPSTIANDCQWEFYINLQFNTSSANYVDVFLMSDNANLLSAGINGYFVRIGNTQDEISLYKRVAGVNTKIIDGVDGVTNFSNNVLKIKVIRDASNLWSLERDNTGTGNSYFLEGTVADADVTTSSFFGIFIAQSTASFFNRHFFDDFYVGPIIYDTDPPIISSVSIISNNQLDVLFDENVELTSAETPANYSVNNGIGPATLATRDASNHRLVHLTFGNTFVSNQNYTITINGVEDLSGNAIVNGTENFLFFIPVVPGSKQVVINEIMAKETPVVGLPDAEFVELFNTTTNQFFQMGGCRFNDPTASALIPSFVLGPGEYAILTSNSNVSKFSAYTNVYGVPSWPNLNNAGDIIWLTTPGGDTIDLVNYSDTWYQDNAKKAGGWTLEKINPFLPCSNGLNWRASLDPSGGTINAQNSIFNSAPDVSAPILLSTNLLSAFDLLLKFNKPLDVSSLQSNDFTISGGITVNDITVIYPDREEFIISFSPGLDTGIVYNITYNGIEDCSGNSAIGSFTLVLPAAPVAGDVIINEVLFNPNTGGSDYVEIYNISDKFIDLQGWYLANLSNGIPANFRQITYSYILKPNAFAVITRDSNFVKQDYFTHAPGTFVHMATMPSYNNADGNVIIALPDSSISELFSYDEKMHFGLLNSVKGKSLERIDYNRPASDRTNWHTAAEALGFGTPGLPNSQLLPGIMPDNMVLLSPEIFSPDNDGFEDVVNINYLMDSPGYVANIVVYDAQGRHVRNLIRSELLGTEGTFSWDGTNDNREKVPVGAYVVFFEAFKLDGTVRATKKPCVVAARF
jgi:hypothetical protein